MKSDVELVEAAFKLRVIQDRVTMVGLVGIGDLAALLAWLGPGELLRAGLSDLLGVQLAVKQLVGLCLIEDLSLFVPRCHCYVGLKLVVHSGL